MNHKLHLIYYISLIYRLRFFKKEVISCITGYILNLVIDILCMKCIEMYPSILYNYERLVLI